MKTRRLLVCAFSSIFIAGRFSGHIQLTPGIPGTVLGKKSFCAFRSPVFRPPLNLADYIGLEMRVRTSNHGFVFNIHPDNMVPSDLFHERDHGRDVPAVRHHDFDQRVSFDDQRSDAESCAERAASAPDRQGTEETAPVPSV